MQTLTPEKQMLLARFSTARPEVRRFLPDLAAGMERFFPALAGRLVRNADDPRDGYATAVEARAAARRYREGAKVFLSRMVRAA